MSVLFPSFTRLLTLYSRPVCLFVSFFIVVFVYDCTFDCICLYSFGVYITGRTGQTRLRWDEITYLYFFLFQCLSFYEWPFASWTGTLFKIKVSTSDLVTYFLLADLYILLTLFFPLSCCSCCQNFFQTLHIMPLKEKSCPFYFMGCSCKHLLSNLPHW